jgi:malonyl-CoA O-methyltransferase
MNVKNAYAEWARIYDSNENLTRDLDRQILPHLLKEIKGKHIVEAGCGTGKNTVWFAQEARRVIAFDLSDHMLRIATEKVQAGHVKIIKHDILKTWPVDDLSADIVSINLVLEHFPTIDFPIQEAYRILKERGILCVCELHPQKHLSGSQAKYVDPETNSVINVESYMHMHEEFENAGRHCGFTQVRFQDWYDEVNQDIPRLLSVLYQK